MKYIMSEKEIISHIPNREIFMNLLTKNPGLIVIKFGAKWCGPCKRIKSVVHGFFASSPDDVLCCDIDVDECSDLYSFLKSKKMINGIPVMLCYKKMNQTFIPDDSVVGADPAEIDRFFRRCGEHLMHSRIEGKGRRI
jgi:thiol-disulfide isomerase/thioredoxin